MKDHTNIAEAMGFGSGDDLEESESPDRYAKRMTKTIGGRMQQITADVAGINRMVKEFMNRSFSDPKAGAHLSEAVNQLDEAGRLLRDAGERMHIVRAKK